MKRKFLLSPSLAQIEHRLFGVTDALIASVRAGEIPESLAAAVRQSNEWAAFVSSKADDDQPFSDKMSAPAPVMPAHLRNLIARKAASQNLRHGLPPAQGQIVQIRRIVTPLFGQLDWVLQAPLSVLLDAPAETQNVWHGWLMSSEADYAGWWDFVLQAEDEPFDPEAAMVQVWNPVRLYLPMIAQVTGELKPARLQAVRALAAEFATSNPPVGMPAWPGRVAVRTTIDDLQVATGSPIRADDDPRRRYQHLYFHAAEAVREPARLALAEAAPKASPMESLRQRLVAAAGALGQQLLPVPRVANAMAEGDFEEPDLLWLDLARIRIVATDSATGEIEVLAIGEQSITCRLIQAGALYDKRTVSPGEEPVVLAWEIGTKTELALQANDGRALTLPLDE